nr:hypothetical protein [Tanacetum cinerariifolium]
MISNVYNTVLDSVKKECVEAKACYGMCFLMEQSIWMMVGVQEAAWLPWVPLCSNYLFLLIVPEQSAGKPTCLLSLHEMGTCLTDNTIVDADGESVTKNFLEECYQLYEIYNQNSEKLSMIIVLT